MSYRVVEFEQNLLGKALSRLLPDALQPAMRRGDGVVLSRKVDRTTAEEIRENRRRMLKQVRKHKSLSVEIEELWD